MKLYYIFFISSLFLLISCNNDDDQISNTSESLVFGIYAGECSGDCFAIFRINNATLEEDQNTNFFIREEYSFIGSFTFPNEEFVVHRDILNKILQEFFAKPDTVYGCPDCADQGGFYFVIQTADGKTKKHIVDTNNTEDQSAEIIALKNKISEIIQVLSMLN